MSQFIPENALKSAQEKVNDGAWEEAIDVLHQSLKYKRNRGNNAVLEKLMLNMIEISVQNLSMTNLKEDIGHFRNLCQHTNLSLLENVLKTLRNKSEDLLNNLEEREGIDTLKKILNMENSIDNIFLQEGETHPDDLMYLANCQLDELEQSDKIIPVVVYFFECCKIILDVLRQNSRMLDFYNLTATKCFEICIKYQCKKEFKKISETLHSHFNQILKQSKNPESSQSSKIPYPVKIEEEECHQKLLELRYEQLKVCLDMQEWSDAFKTSENIYQLINRYKSLNAAKMKPILHNFFNHLQKIFWHSQLYLFHAYSLMNLQQIIRSNRTINEQDKMKIASQFILSVLSVSLNNRISNFEKLAVQYMPQGMNEVLEENTGSTKNEIFQIAQMLLVKGYPSRQSLINYVKIQNIQSQSASKLIGDLFNLIEQEESPFTISSKGQKDLEEIVSHYPEFKEYEPFIKKNLSVRILQKCKNYYKNLKFSALQSLLTFYQNFEEIELLLYECNREGLIKVVIDHSNQVIIFDQEREIANNLQKFGVSLKQAFVMVREEKENVEEERVRIFQKVKEKLEQEMNEVIQRKEEMIKLKEDIKKVQQTDQLNLQKILEDQQKVKDKEDIKAQIQIETIRKKNEQLELLELLKKIRAKEVLLELKGKGIKNIGKEKISELLKKEEIDYDMVMQFYQNQLKRESEQNEIAKKQKLKEVEYWARAVKEEEKLFTEKYCREYGEEETKNIQKAIEERYKKESQVKNTLKQALPCYKVFKEEKMKERNEDLQIKMEKFITQEGEKLKKQLLEDALSTMRKIENRKLVEKKQAEILAKQKLLNSSEKQGGDDDQNPSSWRNKGAIQEIQPQPERTENKDSGFFSRKEMGGTQSSQEQQQPSRGDNSSFQQRGPPKFLNSKQNKGVEDTTGFSRKAMGTSQATQNEEQKTYSSTGGGKPTQFSRKEEPSSTQQFTRGGGGAAWKKQEESQSTGFQRGAGAQQDKGTSRGGGFDKGAAKDSKKESKEDSAGGDWVFAGGRQSKR